MDYNKHYNLLMQQAPRTKPKGVYTECHRIIPGCMGGKYTDDNIAYLTPEQHYTAHQLLVKMYPSNYKLAYAASIMTISSGRQCRSNKKYGWVRRKFAQEVSKRNKGKTPWNKGLPSPMKGKNIKGHTAWNKGMKNPLSAASGKKGAAKQAATVTGRRRLYQADGSWTWHYPQKNSAPKDAISGSFDNKAFPAP